MRRLVFPAILATGLVMAGAVPASAEPAPTEASVKAAAGKKVCKITDSLLPELSGIVATKNGFAVVNDGADEASRRKVFFLDDECDIKKKVDYPSRPLDTEDLVLSPDGDTLWIADIGDNNARDGNGETRPTIGLWSMPSDGSKEPKIHRLKYPDGDKHDAEALLFNGDGTPIIVTKEVTGKTRLYTPTAPLKTNNEEGVPLKRAGEIELPSSDTPGIPIARLAQTTVTGGAMAPGGGRVTLRTYLDAYEWDVADGDVLGALKNKPRKTGLPNEPFGEAITYSTDGKYFYTVSDMGTGADQESANYILRYTPSTKIVEAQTAEAASTDGGASWFANLSLTDITYLIGGVGVLGALLVGAGVIGIMQARKKRKLEPAAKNSDPAGPDPLDAQTELLSVGGPAQRPGVYGGNRPPAGAPSAPGVYGGKPPKPPKGTGVYGGGRPPADGQPGARPAGGRPGAQPAGPGGRPGQGGQPGGRPGQGGQPAGRPGAAPAGPGARPGAAPAGPGARPGAAPAGPGGRPGASPAPGGRPGAAPAPGGRPGAAPAGPGGRPGQGGQPGGRPGQGGQPAVRPGQPPARPAPGQPGGGQPGGGQPGGGRPGQGGGRPGNGVYGAPPPPPPPPATGRPAGGGPQRPSGPGQGGGQRGGPQGGQRPDGGRQSSGMNSYADLNGSSRGGERRFDNPGYGRTPRGY
jgi:hypothetical protein